MGKGTRNRLNREIDGAKTKKKIVRKYRKPLPKFVKPLISIVLLVAIIVGTIVGIVANNGTFKRGNILVKSETGKYDLNQQMATYIAWQTAYYQSYYTWQIYSSQLASYYSSYQEYCLNTAASTIQGQLHSSIEELAAGYMVQYVAVCDEAERQGITLTAEEIAEAKKSAVEDLMSFDCYYYPTTASFIKAVIGHNVKQKDIENVGVMEALYNKYLSGKRDVYEKVALSIVEKYRDDNPESFYKTDYLVYETKDAALATTLEGKTEAKAFLIEVVKANFEKKYKEQYNKYMSDADAFRNDLNGLTDATVAAKLTEKGLTAEPVTNNTSTIDATLKTWIMDPSRKQYETTKLTAGDKYIVVLITETANAGTVKAAWKEFAFSEGIEFDAPGDPSYDANFKQNLLDTILKNLKLTETAPGKDYTENKNEKIQPLFTALTKDASEVLPKTTSVSYTKQPGDDVIKSWLFGNMTGLTSPVAVGATKKTEETKDEVTTYKVYITEKVMYLDETTEEGSTTPGWETAARSAYASSEISTLLKTLSEPYQVSEKALNKIKDKEKTQAATSTEG